MEFVANLYLLSVKDLRRAIFVETSGEGFAARFDREVFRNSRLKGNFQRMKQMDETLSERQPVFERLDGHDVSYPTSAHAVVALLLHLLLNIRQKGGSSWTFRKLKHTKELVLVVPVAHNMTTMEAVCTLFRQDNTVGTKVLCRYFDGQGESLAAFEVTTDDDGFFEDKTRH